jgi:hypothetical protein
LRVSGNPSNAFNRAGGVDVSRRRLTSDSATASYACTTSRRGIAGIESRLRRIARRTASVRTSASTVWPLPAT